MRLRRRAARRGFTLIETIVAISILTGALLGMAVFVKNFTRSTTNSSNRVLANDLVNARIEEIKGWRVYSTLVTTFNATTTTYGTGSIYRGFTRRTFVTRTNTANVHDYVTVTVRVTGRSLPATVSSTTIIARF